MSLLPDANELLRWIKQAAVDAVKQTKPVQLVYGKVVTTSPLSVRLDQQRTLTANFLKRLDYTATASDGVTVEVKEFSKGDEVAMLQKQGGQEFLILGKVE